MFSLAIALLALAIICFAFGIYGVAGYTAIVASVGLLLMSAAAMVTYWRRRPA